MRILLAVVFCITTMLLLRRNMKTVFPILFVYFVGVVYLTFLIRESRSIYHLILSPFYAAKEAIELGGPWFFLGIKVVKPELLEGIVLNVLLFIPFGYLLPLIWRRADHWWKVMLIGLIASALIEALQLVLQRGFADVDDLINNTLGTLVGWCCYQRFLKVKLAK